MGGESFKVKKIENEDNKISRVSENAEVLAASGYTYYLCTQYKYNAYGSKLSSTASSLAQPKCGTTGTTNYKKCYVYNSSTQKYDHYNTNNSTSTDYSASNKSGWSCSSRSASTCAGIPVSICSSYSSCKSAGTSCVAKTTTTKSTTKAATTTKKYIIIIFGMARRRLLRLHVLKTIVVKVIVQ